MTPSINQKEIYQEFQTTRNNININAVAGSGKTTTLLFLLSLIPKGKTALFVAFNNTIVDELKARTDRTDVDIMTIHSYGWRCILRHFHNVKMNPDKAIMKTAEVFQKYLAEGLVPQKKKGYYFYIVPKLIDLLRCNLLENSKENFLDLAEHHCEDIEPIDAEIAVEVFRRMEKDSKQFDFTDMIYQPNVSPFIKFKKYDYVFCDESQDFSLAQQGLINGALNRRGRLITVGDPYQAIYGFAGADANSYERLTKMRPNSVQMPLSVCYRCAKKIVEEAQKIVPQISYSPNAPEGEVLWGDLMNVKPGDWIVCRNLKPLVQTCLWLLKNRIKSKIRGKDIGAGLLNLVIETGAKTLSGLEGAMKVKVIALEKKLRKKGIKSPSLHPKMEALLQKIEVLELLCDEVNTVSQLKAMLEDIFTEETKGILLTTIHKSKGLENDTIYFLCPELIPSKYAVLPWQLKQESNLKYVAITRAKKTLIYVPEYTFKDNLEQRIVKVIR